MAWSQSHLCFPLSLCTLSIKVGLFLSRVLDRVYFLYFQEEVWLFLQPKLTFPSPNCTCLVPFPCVSALSQPSRLSTWRAGWGGIKPHNKGESSPWPSWAL